MTLEFRPFYDEYEKKVLSSGIYYNNRCIGSIYHRQTDDEKIFEKPYKTSILLFTHRYPKKKLLKFEKKISKKEFEKYEEVEKYFSEKFVKREIEPVLQMIPMFPGSSAR